MGFSSCLMCFLPCFEMVRLKQHEICSLPECAMRCFSDLWKTVDVSRALAISQKRKRDAMQLSKQTKGHKLHQIARWIKSTCLKLRLDSHSPHAPCTFNYFGASHGETNEWIEADITWHNMPTNILHSTNSAVSASLTHMHSSENVNYRESFVTQPNTLAGLNRSPCMLDLCTGFAILMLSKRKGSSSSRNVWYLPASSELHFVWPNPSWSKVRIKDRSRVVRTKYECELSNILLNAVLSGARATTLVSPSGRNPSLSLLDVAQFRHSMKLLRKWNWQSQPLRVDVPWNLAINNHQTKQNTNIQKGMRTQFWKFAIYM